MKMEIKDLEKGIIIWPYEIEKKGLDTDLLQHVCDSKTPFVKGFYEKNMRKKLTEYIRKDMQKNYARISIITQEENVHSFLTRTRYSYSMYKI